MVSGRGQFHDRVLRTAFIRAFINGPTGVRGNVTRAVMHAGMASTDSSAKVVGMRLMRDPELITDLERKMMRTDASNDRILEELARVAFADIREVVEWGPESGDAGGGDTVGVRLKASTTIDDDTAAAIAEISQRTGKNGARDFKVKMHGKIEALSILARVQSMIAPTRVQVTGEGGGPVQVQFYLPSNGRAHDDVDALPEPAALAS